MIIKLVSSSKCKHDYSVTLLRPDGVEITVMIPDETPGYFNDCIVGANQVPFYLNFVTSDHYR
jgi:hypothetical protein